MAKPTKIPPTHTPTPGDWFSLTVDTHGLAILMAGLQSLLKTESDQMRKVEVDRIHLLYNEMEKSLSTIKRWID